jgi:7,8-dihydropterin-6-yl-methyl-4-(beta-D-ribofuranosyl)aminobenzene 5'-phosphate synthase
MKITVLSDNTVAGRNTRGEHGLAFWIDTGVNSLLFDTGQGLVLADNAQALQIGLDAVDTIVLSHGHYDHTGGLASILRETAGRVIVQAHPSALLPKYQQGPEGVRDIGIPNECRAALQSEQCQFISSRCSQEVAPGVHTTGEIPRRHPQERIAEFFCCDPEGRVPDPLLDDQALFMETAQGTVVILGCAHSGLINTLDCIQDLSKGKPLRVVIGGMHLRSANEERIQWTIRELRRFNLNVLAPMHCTGPKAMAELWAAFPLTYQAVGVGTSFVF